MTPWPEDFAAEWRRDVALRRVAGGMRSFAEQLDVVTREASRVAAIFNALRIAAQAERLSVWRPWR